MRQQTHLLLELQFVFNMANFTDFITSENLDGTENGNQDFPIGLSGPTSIQVVFEGVTGGPPTITISASNNGINFVSLDSTAFPYSAIGANDSFLLIQDHTPYKYLRVAFLANGATAGTYSISISKK